MGMDNTPFSFVYETFLSRVTDDMFLELTVLDTYQMLEDLLLSALPKFEFPRVNLDYELLEYVDEQTYCGVESDFVEVPAVIYAEGYFVNHLTQEEAGIIATYMIVEWIGQQLASIENTRMKYSGSDFKFTSQGNHLAKLIQLKKEYEREGFHLQRLYKRRKADENGIARSTFGQIMEVVE